VAILPSPLDSAGSVPWPYAATLIAGKEACLRGSRRTRYGNPLLLTVEGEFVVKNLVLLAAGMVVGSRVSPIARLRESVDQGGGQAGLNDLARP
jgi:hypothetical protein